MTIVALTRMQSTDTGIIGEVRCNGFAAVSLESADYPIPVGDYQCTLTWSDEFQCYLAIPTEFQTLRPSIVAQEGVIAFGSEVVDADIECMLLHSYETMETFYNFINGRKFILRVQYD